MRQKTRAASRSDGMWQHSQELCPLQWADSKNKMRTVNHQRSPTSSFQRKSHANQGFWFCLALYWFAATVYHQIRDQFSFFSFSQNPTLLPPPAHMAPCPQATGRLSSGQLQLPTTYKQGDPKHSPSSPDLSVPSKLSHTHTPVDTQNGAGHGQHAGGPRGDHAVKWIRIISLRPFIGGVRAP